MKIAIYHHGIPFDGSTPFRQGLGGSEASIVYMARELARLEHDVTVYANSARAIFDGVTYRHYHDFFTDYRTTPWDVVVSFRSFDPFFLGRVAPRTIFWCGDAYDQPKLEHFGHRSLQENIDLVFCVSNYHRNTFIQAFQLAPEKVIATRNGFCPELVPPVVPHREWTRCVYSSTPFRGLEILLKVFPAMQARVPALFLDVFSSMQVYGWTADADEKEFGRIYQAADQPGVHWHGSIDQPSLLKHLARAGLFLYPNTFDETSCIAAIEAQACGCVVVTSARAGLNETVLDRVTGICLPGDPESGRYQQQFVSTVLNLLGNPPRLHELSTAARERAFLMYSWPTIAKEWTGIFKDMDARGVSQRWGGPLGLLQKGHRYLENGNVNALARVLMELEQTPFLRNEVEVLKGKLSTWM
jgi:glycosyltransferase involved in cell wall biosynthesis